MIFFIGLLIFLLFFTFQYSNIEHLNMDNISTNTADNCDCTTQCATHYAEQCSEAKSLSNLVAQYNLLNDKIVQLTATVAQIDAIKTMVDNNKKSIDDLNSSIKQFSDLMTKK